MRGLYRILRGIVRHPMNRGRSLKALSTFVKWQIGSRIVPGPVIIPFVENAVLVAAPGMSAATGNLYSGLYGFEEMSFLLHALRPGNLFVDVGANIGAYTVLASAVAGANCVSFEPVPGTFSSLRRNVRLNDVGAFCDLHQAAVGGDDGVLRFTSGEDATNHVVPGNATVDAGTITVPVFRMDTVIGERQPAIIKIDAEGFETEVLNGAKAILERPLLNAILIQLNGRGASYGFDENLIHRRLLNLGFHPHSYSPLTRRLTALPERSRTSRFSLYLRNADQIRQLTATASGFRVRDQII